MNVYVSESRMEYYSMLVIMGVDIFYIDDYLYIYIISIYLTWKWVLVTHYPLEDPQTQS